MQKHLGYFSPAFVGPEGCVSLRLGFSGVQSVGTGAYSGRAASPWVGPVLCCWAARLPGGPMGPREALTVAHGLGHHLKGLSFSRLSFLTILSHSFSHKGVEA